MSKSVLRKALDILPENLRELPFQDQDDAIAKAIELAGDRSATNFRNKLWAVCSAIWARTIGMDTVDCHDLHPRSIAAMSLVSLYYWGHRDGHCDAKEGDEHLVGGPC